MEESTPVQQPAERAQSQYLLPERRLNSQGEERRVGIEVEYAGLGVEASAALVRDLYGGRIVEKEHLAVRVVDTTLGDFGVEIDSTPLRKRKYLDVLRKLGVDTDESKLAEWVTGSVEGIAASVVPCEVVSPPVPMSRLHELDRLWHALTAQHAEGTHQSILYAFGLHFNPEVPSFDASVLHGYLRAFVLLVDWIVSESDVDVSRKLSPYIDSYPAEYREHVVDPQYRPSLDELVADYLHYNPTRNRQLDLLPLFSHLQPERVRAACEEPELVKSRPTFHYRLPNCDLGIEGWTPAADWNRWIEVEKLAAQPERLDELSAQYLDMMRDHAWRGTQLWRQHIAVWLDERASSR